MFHYPLDQSLQRQQPLVFLEDQVFGLTTAAAGSVTLVTAVGRRHPLVPYAAQEALGRAGIRRNLEAAEALLQAELPRRVAAQRTDPVTYFVDYLAPTFELRDWSEDAALSTPVVREPPQVDWTVALRDAAQGIPAPKFVAPAMLICGRVWLLREAVPRPGCTRVIAGSRCFVLDGNYHVVSRLASEWQAVVSKYLLQSAEQLATRVCGEDATATVSQARQELASSGSIARRDLLFLPGAPPRVGVIVPEHYNRTLGRQSNRDLAMTAPLTLPQLPPANKSVVCVYARTGAAWHPASLPHGLCLGPDAPSYPQDSPGMALASLLRWAGVRVAENGIFHSSDESSDSA